MVIQGQGELTYRERVIMDLRGRGLARSEVARQLGCTVARIRWIERKATAKLQRPRPGDFLDGRIRGWHVVRITTEGPIDEGKGLFRVYAVAEIRPRPDSDASESLFCRDVMLGEGRNDRDCLKAIAASLADQLANFGCTGAALTR